MFDDNNCQVEPLEKSIDASKFKEAHVSFFNVFGMGSPRCATRVRNRLLVLDGVLLVDVALDKKIATVFYDPEEVTPLKLEKAVVDAGNDGKHYYRAEIINTFPADEVLQL